MTNSTNSYFYPVFEEDRFDYVEHDLYTVELDTSNTYTNQSKDSLVLKYKVKDNNLIADFIKKGEARFVCTTVVKSTMYRETITDIIEIDKSNPLEVIQVIPLQDTKEVQQFSPMIIYTGEDKNIKLDSKKMGLDDFWDNKEITLLKGSIIAKDGWRETEYSASDLLSIKRDESVEHSFNVMIQTSEGGRFVAYVNPELFDNMNKQKSNSQKAHFNSIVTHMLCVGFMKLREEYKEGTAEDLTNFKALERKLRVDGLSSWEDNEDFDPNRAACHFLPHILRTEDLEDE